MDNFKQKLLLWAQKNRSRHSLVIFSFTWTIFLATCFSIFDLASVSLQDVGVIVLLSMSSIVVFSSFKRFMNKKETEAALSMTKATLFLGFCYTVIMPIGSIVSSEFSVYVGFAVALVLYLIACKSRSLMSKSAFLEAKQEEIKELDVLAGVEAVALTPEQKKAQDEARKKAKIQMREEKKERKAMENSAGSSPEDLDLTSQFSNDNES